MPETFVSDASLVFAAGFSKHCSNVIRRQRHSQFLHGLLKLLLVYVTIAVFVKHLTVTNFRQKLVKTFQQLFSFGFLMLTVIQFQFIFSLSSSFRSAL